MTVHINVYDIITSDFISHTRSCLYPAHPPRVEYALSEFGETMRPIIQSMEARGIDYKNKNYNS